MSWRRPGSRLGAGLPTCARAAVWWHRCSAGRLCGHRVRHLSPCCVMRTGQRGVRGRGRGCAPGVVGARSSSRRSTSSSAIRRTCRMIRASTTRCRPRSDRRAHGTPDTTGDWCSIRSARPCPTSWRTAAALLLVQSEFADPRLTLAALSSAGLDAEIVAWQWIPFGPALTSRTWWLEETDRLDPGRREEELLVVRADKP